MTAALTAYLAFGILGLIVGSFLNVVIIRYEKGEKPGGRSYCPSCRAVLRWFELVPVVSYLLQKGRCRSCASLLSKQYILVELLTAGIFVLAGRKLLPSVARLGEGDLMSLIVILVTLFVWSTLIVIAVYDLRTTYIPDLFVVFFALGALSFQTVLGGGVPDTTTLAAGPLLFLPFYLLWRVSHGVWLGLGDGKLAWGIGWLLGLSAGLSAIVLAFWLGAAMMLALLGLERGVTYLHSKKGMYWLRRTTGTLTLKSEIPFAPFLILGTALVFFLEWNALALFF